MFYGYGVLNNHVPTLKATTMGGGVSTLMNGIYYAFNADNSYVSPINSNGGSGIGGMTFGTGLINQCFVSNGTNSYINYTTASLNFTNSFSTSFWVKTSSLQIGSNGLVSSYNFSSGNYGYIIGLSALNKIDLYWNNTSDNSYASTNSINLNQWNHVVVVWDKTNTNWKVYINNTLDINITIAAANNIRYSTQEKSNICGTYNDSANSLNGSMDAISFWNRAITLSEVNSLYNSGNGKQYPY